MEFLLFAWQKTYAYDYDSWNFRFTKRSMTTEYVFCVHLNIDLYDYDRRVHILESLKFNYLVAIVRKNVFMGSRPS